MATHRPQPVGAIPRVGIRPIIGHVAIGVVGEAAAADLVQFVERARRAVVVGQVARDVVAVGEGLRRL